MQDRSGASARLKEAASSLAAGDLPAAEAAYCAALLCDHACAPAATGLADLLVRLGRPDEALHALAPFVAQRPADHSVLIAQAAAEKALGRADAVLATHRRAAREHPSRISAHNLAGALGDLSQFEEAATEAKKALDAGLDAPQTWMVYARALLALGRLDESDLAFRRVLARVPSDPDAWREYTQFVWMRTGDAAQALSPLDAALRARGPDPRLMEVRAVAQKFFGDTAGAYDTAFRASEIFPQDAAVQVAATHLAILAGDRTAGLAHAEAAIALSRSLWTGLNLCEALFAIGDAARAAPIIENLRKMAPLDQNVVAYQATAWRLLGDERYHALYDYNAFVSTQTLDTPKGWASLPAFLSDLRAALEQQHALFRAHPFQQSLLNGSQVNNLIASPNPAIKAFFEAVADPIRRRVEALGSGDGVLRSRNTLQTRFEGVWSVRLTGGGGRHVGHVHPKGWLSSACYIALPGAIGRSSTREGWLKFGQPGIATEPALPPEHFVRPEEGALALFPSYMWHGTEPFAGEDVRLSVAFDLVPAG